MMSEPEVLEKNKQLEDYVDDANYAWMNDGYVPSTEALEFVAFIKLVNGAKGEENKTPAMHLVMLDDFIHKNDNLFIVHRGGAKALALDTQIPTPKGNVLLEQLEVGDKVFTRNGTPTPVTHKSEIFHKRMFELVLEDGRMLKVSEDHLNIVQKRKTGKGVPSGLFVESVLTTLELLEKKVTYKRKVSSFNPSGSETKWWVPTASLVEYPATDSPIDPYTVGAILGDGSIDKQCGFTRFHTHVDDAPHFLANLEGAEEGTLRSDSRRESTLRFSLKGLGQKVKSFIGVENVYGKRIPQALLWGSSSQRIAVLQGLMDTNGTLGTSGHGSFCTVSEGLANDVAWLVRSLGGEVTFGNEKGNYFRLHIRTNFCPFRLQRKADKWKPCLKGRTGIREIFEIESEPSQCIAVADPTHSFLAESFMVTHNTTVIHEYAFLYIAVYGKFFHWGRQDVAIYVSDTMENGVKNMREQLEFRWNDSAFLQQYVPWTKFTDDRWEFENADGKRFFVKGFAALTGVRGFKKYGKRPTWCGFDDLLSDKNAKSPTILADIENVIYKAAMEALHPTKRKIAWTGTPFSKGDSLYKAAGSGAWNVKAFPLCEKFPCAEEEYRGSWEDRFTYQSTLENYNKKLKNGKLAAFNQELMLRITSDEDRLVLDTDLMWYERNMLIHNQGVYNFYITTDWATSETQSADYSVTAVWAINNKGFWFLVDGACARQNMDKNIDDLFRFAQMYKTNLQSAGIEVSGQQGGFIQWVQKEMMVRNIWFNLASDNNGNKLGIRPNAKKLTRFQTVVPWFKAKRMFFPQEFKDKHPLMIEMQDELNYVTKEGFKSAHDDAADTISMLAVMNAWQPSQDTGYVEKKDSGIWSDAMFTDDNETLGIDSYLP